MMLDLPSLARLSALLDDAWELDAPRLQAWLAALPAPDQRLVPRLRELLAERGGADQPAFLASMPAIGRPGDDAAHAGQQVGAYTLQHEIGRGGMSAVWLAERSDGTLKRPVALKMPLLTLRSPLQAERFERERDVLAKLAHPQIARLYDAGVEPSGRPFVVLEFVDGSAITDACDARRLGIAPRLRLFLQVLAAVDHAHKHLIVHRDIKPGNVFVDADGQVKLLDFGIAKLVDAPAVGMQPSALTVEGGHAMTPRYAAPEQIDRRPISTATDVYSLGVLLHELLTGALPHDDANASTADVMQAILYAEPARPSSLALPDDAAERRGFAQAPTLRSALAGDLDTIVLKALRKSPAERYASVERFADDVQRFLDHRPIAARPATLAYRTRLFWRRHRLAGVAASIGLVGILAFGATTWQQHLRSVEEKQRGDAVRDFMFLLVEDAEADDQHPSGDPTGRQMIASAVTRARTGYALQPRVQGELLSELGIMTWRFGDDEQALRLLEEALALLQGQAPDDDAALNKTRAQLAGRLLDAGQTERAEMLATLARQRCTQGSECARARMYGAEVMVNVETLRAHVGQALADSRDAVRESEIGFGPRHAETAEALVDLAIVARQAGQLDAARQALDRAIDIGRNTTLRLADRADMLRTSAVLDIDLGNYARASERMTELLSAARTDADKAFEARLLATAQLGLGEVDAALASAGLALSVPAAAVQAIERAFAHQAHARALALKGQDSAAEAVTEMSDVLVALHGAGYAPASMEVLRARRMLAEAQVRQGLVAVGLQGLMAVSADQASAAPGQEVEWAATLDLIGCVLRSQGRATEALVWHRQAAGLLQARLPADHPLRQRNALYVAAATWRATPTPESAATLARAAAAYGQRFPADSLWRRVAAEAATGGTGPAFML